MTVIPSPTKACPTPASCFYCRWWTRCPLHAGDPIDWTGYLLSTLTSDPLATLTNRKQGSPPHH